MSNEFFQLCELLRSACYDVGGDNRQAAAKWIGVDTVQARSLKARKFGGSRVRYANKQRRSKFRAFEAMISGTRQQW